MKWLYLSLALICESIGFATLKLSQGFSKTTPTIATILVDVMALLFFIMALKKFETSFVYMVAAGVGTVLVVLTNVIVFKQTLNWTQITCILLIIIGSVGLQSQGSTH
jgi:multidrug transporter EmrE-like cation transporter